MRARRTRSWGMQRRVCLAAASCTRIGIRFQFGIVANVPALEHGNYAVTDVHDHFLEHPAIAPFLEGGELIEYGCHMIAEGGAKMQHDLVRPGLVVIGDAAGFSAEHRLYRARDGSGCGFRAGGGCGDRGGSGRWRLLLRTGWRATWQNTRRLLLARTWPRTRVPPEFLESPEMYGKLGEMLADVFHGVYNLDLTPRKAHSAHRVGCSEGVWYEAWTASKDRLSGSEGSLMQLGNVESRLAKNSYEVDEGNTHIEVNQEIARATGTGRMLTKICPAHVFGKRLTAPSPSSSPPVWSAGCASRWPLPDRSSGTIPRARWASASARANASARGRLLSSSPESCHDRVGLRLERLSHEYPVAH